jgi:hypothetical protein
MRGRHQHFEDPMTWTRYIKKTKFYLVRFFDSAFKGHVQCNMTRYYQPHNINMNVANSLYCLTCYLFILAVGH